MIDLSPVLGAEEEPHPKEIQRATAASTKIIGKIDKLLERTDLSQHLRSRLKECRAALRGHLKQEELVGALRDNLSLPIREGGTGRVWDHLQEAEDAMESMRNAKHALGVTFRASLPADLGALELSPLADDLGDLLRAVQNVVGVEQ